MLIHKYELTALNIINKNNKIITFSQKDKYGVYTQGSNTNMEHTHGDIHAGTHTYMHTYTHIHPTCNEVAATAFCVHLFFVFRGQYTISSEMSAKKLEQLLLFSFAIIFTFCTSDQAGL